MAILFVGQPFFRGAWISSCWLSPYIRYNWMGGFWHEENGILRIDCIRCFRKLFEMDLE